MATDPRQGFGPNDLLSDLATNFENLAAVLQEYIERLDSLCDQKDALSHLQSAREEALHGAQLAGDANE